MNIKLNWGQRLKRSNIGAQAPKAQNVTLHRRWPAGNGAQMRDGLYWLDHRQGQAGADGQGMKGQQNISNAGKRARKYKAIQTLDVGCPGRDRVSLGIDPHKTGCVTGTKFDQHGALCRTSAARSGQDKGERK